jgi:two-component system, sensor histidine kinase and response regulator
MKNIEQSQILVVDDNKANRDLIARHLQFEGYRVTLAEDGICALQLIETQKFDLVLLDVMMPGLTGFEVLKTIRQTHTITELPVIMATALGQSGDIIEGFRSGATDYVTKPIDFPVLTARVAIQLQLRNLTRLKDEFIQVASHDLKNPLNNILMSAFLVLHTAKAGDTLTEEMLHTLSFITRHGNEMKQIINDFLDFQALKDGNLQLHVEPVSLNDLAASVVLDNTEYAQYKNIDVRLELDNELPRISGDEMRLAQVIHNLVGNAIKFCREKSTVTVKTSVQDNAAVVEVCDTGPGLTDADLAIVFSKYSRLSNKPTGGEKSSGLGLAICKQMIEMQGGTIGVRNNPDRGATFWFSIPVESITLRQISAECEEKIALEVV